METIPYAQWEKLDLRVGKILSVEDHPNADKLYLVEIDLGKLGKKKLVAGLKKAYKPKQMIGKLCVVFANLEPAEIRGVKSEGMILCAVDDNGNVQMIAPKKMELGSKIR